MHNFLTRPQNVLYGLKYIDEYGYGRICKDYKIEFPPQHQDKQSGMEYLMTPKPIFNNP